MSSLQTSNLIYLKKIEDHLNHMIVNDESLIAVLRYIIDEFIRLLNGDVDYQELILTSTYRPPYKCDKFFIKLYVDNLNALSNLGNLGNPGSLGSLCKPVSPGDRVEYIVLDVNNNGSLDDDKYLGNKLIHPDMYNGESINYMYYIKIVCKRLDRLIKIHYSSVLPNYNSITHRRSLRHKVITMDTPVKLISDVIEWSMESPYSLIEQMEKIDLM